MRLAGSSRSRRSKNRPGYPIVSPGLEGLHVCKQYHTAIDAGVNGAYNILKVAVDRIALEQIDMQSSGSRLMAQPLMLRWEYPKWHYEPLPFKVEDVRYKSSIAYMW